jgi:hypothetical protein
VTGTNGVKKNSARKKENFSAKKKISASTMGKKGKKKTWRVFFFIKSLLGIICMFIPQICNIIHVLTSQLMLPYAGGMCTIYAGGGNCR